jgi:hypothetical protein
MSNHAEIQGILRKYRFISRVGAFYSGASERPLGTGIILDDCRIPFWDDASLKFRTGRGLACVITHECDIDPENERFFNDTVLVIPIIDFKIWYQDIKAVERSSAENIATSLVKDEVYRALYLPTIPDTKFDYGGILYLNQITNVSVADIRSRSRVVCSLTTFSHALLDRKLQNHLFRPKAVPLMTIH